MAVYLGNLGWIPLVLADLLVLKFFSLFSAIDTVITTILMEDSMLYLGRVGGSLSGSVVKTEVIWFFRKFASFLVSVTSLHHQ